MRQDTSTYYRAKIGGCHPVPLFIAYEISLLLLPSSSLGFVLRCLFLLPGIRLRSLRLFRRAFINLRFLSLLIRFVLPASFHRLARSDIIDDRLILRKELSAKCQGIAVRQIRKHLASFLISSFLFYCFGS